MLSIESFLGSIEIFFSSLLSLDSLRFLLSFFREYLEEDSLELLRLSLCERRPDRDLDLDLDIFIQNLTFEW